MLQDDQGFWIEGENEVQAMIRNFFIELFSDRKELALAW